MTSENENQWSMRALLAGSAFGFAMNSGRIAAENALDYVRGKLGG